MGCNSEVPIKNQRWYADKGILGAVYFETYTQATGQISEEEWQGTRFGMVCSDPQNFADTKAALEKLCNETKECLYIKTPEVQAFFKQIDALKNTVHSR